ncbi:uncharacterized protein LOC114332467 isoform X2 [Diabrotica virgifera virgifera]|uniref:DUF4745 domain-containing protein n=1 Tax=Diabrotica virgifera virgifera TaxID=50390 RepID=A0ABM5KT41_DIAVI|nr:uncharacterized protein LOC114332467 isoform X2 [Diabrotica virgifera virgifera]
MEQGEGREDKKSEETQQQLSPNALKVAAAECLNSWIHYLQMLNSMCAAGLRLSQSLNNLSQMQNIPFALQCQSSWEELSKSTAIASNSVKTHIANAMQDMSIGDTFTEGDAQRQQEHNQQIITENLLAFVNLQYQFSIAGCENFGSMAMCPLCQTAPGGIHSSECSLAALQQCFNRLYPQESSSQRSSPHLPSERMESPKGHDISRGEVPRQKSPHSEREHSPHAEGIHRGQSPIHVFGDGSSKGVGPLETLRGPFPIPGPLHTMKSPFPGRGSRSPLHFPLFPLSCQRRWSEAGVADSSGESGDEQRRRWSMPWDSAWGESGSQGQQRYLPSKLAVPSGYSQEKSRSTTPVISVIETVPSLPQPPSAGPGILPSTEGLAEAIHLLSCRPARCSIPQTASQHYMPHWGETHEERMHRRMMYPGPASQRGNWQSIDVPHSSGMSVTEHCDIFPSGLPLTSRKSSSSTDSSSCLSIHSRSTTSSSERGSASEASGAEAIRIHANLYSMWSGSEHLPFIRLPESQEPLDDSDTDDPPTEKSIGVHFPKPT